MNLKKESLKLHKLKKGKLETISKVKINSTHDLSLVYTPGVAEVCKYIQKKKSRVFDYTIKNNTVAVVTDGSSVLGLGNIGAEASLPVMEGKCILFKKFANVDAFPICLETQNTEEIIKIIRNIAPVFGGINIEDISAPKCFEIESKLQDIGIPVFHDDQHGAAIVVLAALLNSVKVVNKKIEDLTIVISGAGAAGIATAKLLVCFKINKKICNPVKELILCDSKGIIYKGRSNLDYSKREISIITNVKKRKGSMIDALKNADVFIGLSKGNILNKNMIRLMNKDPIIIAMANPIPEIMPHDAIEAGAAIVGTGRSDFKNQINNSLAFPGLFRGALDAKAKIINNEMKLAAAFAIASCIEKPNKDKIIPNMFDKSIVRKVSVAVKKAAIETNVVR